MKNFTYFLLIYSASVLGKLSAQTLAGPNVYVDGVEYSNGQTAFIQCDKTVAHLVAKLVGDGAIAYWKKTTNFTYTNAPTDVDIYLNLDPAKQSGYVDVSGDNFSYSSTRIYIQQKPPVPTFTATPTLCTTGNTATYSASANYAFQSTKPMYFVWQTTGGITVNGSSSYTSPSGTSSSVTVKYNSFGTLSVRGVISACSNLQGDPVSTNIGAYNQPNLTINGVAPYGAVDVQSYPPMSGTYNWYRDGSFLQSTASNYATLNGGSCGQQHFMQVAIANQCGNSPLSNPQYYQYSCSYRVAYPTPAHNDLTLKLEGIEKPDYLPDEVVLLSEKSTVPVRSVKIHNAGTTSLTDPSITTNSTTTTINFNVKDLPRGTYYLQIRNPRNVANPVDAIRVLLQ